MKTTEKIWVIDLEATCWEGTPPKGQVSEIIEIGICLLDVATGSLTQNKGILVKPEQSSVSTFCTQLTTITQDLLDQSGVSFRQACDELNTEHNARQYTWASYGAYDLKMMKAQCGLHAIDFPLSQDHINVKELFAKKKQLQKKKA